MKTKAELRTENAVLKEQLNACAKTLKDYQEADDLAADALKFGTTVEYQREQRQWAKDVHELAQPRIPRTTNG
jgi:hypothetical protein